MSRTYEYFMEMMAREQSDTSRPEDYEQVEAELRSQQNSAPTKGIPKLAYSRRETAQALGISVRSLDRLVSRGLIHPNRHLRCIRFARTEIVRFLAETLPA